MDATDASGVLTADDNHEPDQADQADQAEQPEQAEQPAPPHLCVAVEHRARLAAVVGVLAAVVTVAWFARALQTGGALAWVWCVVLAAVAVVQLVVVRDSRAPLLLADDHGVRVRHGETWSGLRWQDIDHVDVTSRSSWWHDGSIVVHPHEGDGEGPAPVRLSVPLSATTRVRVDGLTGELVDDLDALASGRTPVVVVTRLMGAVETAQEPGDAPDAADEAPEEPTERPEPIEPPEPVEPPSLVRTEVEVVILGAEEDAEGIVLPHQPTAEEREEVRLAPVEPTPDEFTPDEFTPVEPGREPRSAARSESVRETVRVPPAALPMQRGTDASSVVVAPIEVDDLAPRPAAEPVIGPLVAAARHRARLSIDTLSERTRIRPHVLECIEVDDFEPCGGDFYARGHLRTLARVFGLDTAELLALYDEHYARPAIEARQVFEAELATGIGGGVRAVATGPRWSVLAAAVVALGLVWGVAHVFTDQPQEIVSPAPDVDSAGLTHGKLARTSVPETTLAALSVAASGESPQVVVRDRDGRILWAGKLADGQHQQVIGLAPFDVTASNGKAVRVTFLGKSRGTVGPTSAADSRQFG